MFTGIVEAKGKVTRAIPEKEGISVDIALPRSWKVKKGASIAVDGVCLTAVASKPGTFSAYLMKETLRKTTGASWAKGRMVNLERALRAGDRLDGHLLQGHVAGVAKVKKVDKEGASLLVTLTLPAALMKRVALYGAVAVNGVSLTVARRTVTTVTVALIPYTAKETTLGTLRAGDEVNVETDFLGKRGRVGRNEARRAY